ncbi:MAG: tRNA 2-thiouridine(34) synthase MnmA [Desulfatibacillum sp.]|nr:tRNA 2-thiouridine(34) synthase MnmA [Desulfatibacillum sp.]
MSSKIAIAMSGGVDSLVSAHLLLGKTHDLVGVHFLTGYEAPEQAGDDQGAPESLFQAARALGISIHVVRLQAEFQSMVVQPFVETYLKGQTPNPCMVCNQTIKFGALLDTVRRDLGVQRIATGHYARVSEDSRGRFRLFKGADPLKDQSYFLSFLNQGQLGSAIFPLGELTKDQVWEKARQLGLDIHTKPESQETCFIADDRYRNFLQSQPGFRSRPGDIVDIHGKPIGRHEGVFAFTIGQRRGINIPASQAYYVKDIDPASNSIMIGIKTDLLSGGAFVEGINWIVPPGEDRFRARTRIRYRHKEADSTITVTGENTAVAIFDEPQSAVTPGQGAVFYQGDEVLGAGWISSASTA